MIEPGGDDLAGLLARAQALVAEGVADSRSAFHIPALATLGLDGRPRARLVVSRAFDPAGMIFRVHADARSDKIAEIARDPRVALCFYDDPAKLQVRVEGRATLHVDDVLVDAAWAGSRPASLRTYGVEPASGTPISEGGAYVLPSEGAPGGRGNFTVVEVEADAIEVLHLAAAGHRRARFAFEQGALVGATWLAP